MFKKFFSFPLVAVLLSTLPLVSLAFSAESLKNLDVSAAVGPSWYRASNGYLQVTPTETDTLSVSNVTHATTYRFGVGYHFFTDKLSQRKFFNDLLVQLNAYHSSATIKGTVFVYSGDCCENYSFRAPFHTTRLMLDIKPSLFTFHKLSPYAVMGGGVTWNRMALYESPYDTLYAPGTVTLPNTTRTNLAYDLGLGVRGDLSRHLSASVEYLSTHLGRIFPSAHATTQQTVVGAPRFPVRNQNILLGINWKF